MRALIAGGASQRFQYEHANRLVKVKADDNTTVLATYTYGSSNERLIAEEGTLRTYYVGGGGTTIAEYSEIGGSTTPAWSKSYVYLGNRLLSTLTPNGSGGEAVEHHHPDRLGTRIITNPLTGGWSEQVTLPFGTALAAESSGTPSKRRFTSYDRSDATGLDYAVNRHYDPHQGRFTQVDPAGMKATSPLNPQTLNLYAYCSNDPINRTDPNGLGLISWIKKHWKIILVAVAIVVAVLLIPGAPAFLGSFFQHAGQVIISGVGAATEGGGMSTWLKVVLGGAIAAGIFGLGMLTQRTLSFQDQRIKDAKEELLRRLRANDGDNPCARLLGGLKQAEKALKGLKFRVGATDEPRAVAELSPNGKQVTINPHNGFFDTSGSQTITVGLLTNGQRLRITLNNVQFATFILLHELGHKTGNQLIPDGNDPSGILSILNNGKVREACFPELTPAAIPAETTPSR